MLDRRAAIYVPVLNPPGRNEYEISKQRCSNHKDYGDLCDILHRLEKPKRVIGRDGKDLELAPEFFDRRPKEFREEGDFIAIPGEKTKGTLRLYVAEWEMRTFLWTRMVDKSGWFGSYQSNDKIRNQISPFVTIRNSLNRAIAEDRLTVNVGGPGFRWYGETEVLKILPLEGILL